MFLLLFLVALSPGEMWLEASESANWSDEYNYMVMSEHSRLSFSGLLPDPILQFSFAGSPVETRNGPIVRSINFKQQIPWPWLLSSSRNEAEAAYILLEEITNSLILSKRTEIATAWAEVYSRQERIKILEQRATFLTSLLASVSGNSNLLQGEQSVLIDLRIISELANQRPISEQRLFDVSVLALVTQTSIPSDYDFALTIPESEWFTEIALNRTINSPELQVAYASVQRAKAELVRVKAASYPDFTLAASYSFINEPEMLTSASEPGQDSWMLSLGMNLPIGYSGDDYRIQEAEFQVMQTEAHYTQLELEVEAELLQQRVLVINTHDELQIFYQMLPLSESALQAASTSWVAGRGSYSTLTTVLQNHLDIQLAVIEKEALLISSTAKWLELAGAVTNEGEFL